MKLTNPFVKLAVPAAVVALMAAVAGEELRGNDRPTGKPKSATKAGDKLVPLNKAGTVLLDAAGKRVLVQSKVVLREGVLEMLACLKQTKEHESILAVDAKAYVIHTGLLALGARPGRPVQFVKEVETPGGETKLVEEFKPPTGQEIEIYLQWKDKDGKRHRVDARQWVRHNINRYYTAKLKELPADLELADEPRDGDIRYDKRTGELFWFGPMTAKKRDELLARSESKEYRKAVESFYRQSQPREMKARWVFAGSSYHVDEETGKRYYQAEGGDLICVANFPTATIDVGAESSSQQGGLLFEAYTDRIPPTDTEVTIELVPVFEKK